jgi:hypothetical protein
LGFFIASTFFPQFAPMLETVRDDIAQARLKDGRQVADLSDMREYLNQQIERLRQILHSPEGR